MGHPATTCDQMSIAVIKWSLTVVWHNLSQQCSEVHHVEHHEQALSRRMLNGLAEHLQKLIELMSWLFRLCSDSKASLYTINLTFTHRSKRAFLWGALAVWATWAKCLARQAPVLAEPSPPSLSQQHVVSPFLVWCIPVATDSFSSSPMPPVLLVCFS